METGAFGLSNGTVPQPGEGTVVIAMGSTPLELLKQKGLVPKGRTISYMRGKPIPCNGGWYFVTYDPDFTQVDSSATEEIQWDVQLAHRLMTTGSLKPKLGTYGYTHTLEYVRAYVQQKSEETCAPVEVALDLETMGLHPWYKDKRILTVQVSVEPGVADVVYVSDLSHEQFQRFLEDLKWLLTTDLVTLRGANLKFDMVWIAEKWGIECTNFKFDTLLVGSLLNENRSNSLKTHAKVYTAMGGYEDDLKDKWEMGALELVPKDQLLPYAGADTDVCLRVSRAFRAELKLQPRLQQFYVKILQPAARAFEKIERRGMVVDVPKMHELRKELDSEIAEFQNKALAMIPRALRIKYGDEATLSKPALLKEFLFTKSGLNLKPKMVTEKTGEPSMTKEHLSMFADDPKVGPFAKLYEQWGQASKTKSTFVDGFMEHLRPDGRFHPTYMLFNGSMFGGDKEDGGTVTGRTSAKGPAVQTLPKHTAYAKRLRACYPAPPGYLMWQTDFSQGELRIAACVANEDRMIEAFKLGQDLHAKTAAQINGYEFEEFMALSKFPEGSPEAELFAKLRQGGKPANFGLIYGQSAEGFVDYAWKGYQVKLDLATATAQRNGFFDYYSKLQIWHSAYINFARQNLFVESPLGRIRHLPLIRSKEGYARSHAQRQAINSPIQATLSDLCLWSIAMLSKQYPDLWIAGMTHDSLLGYCKEEEADQWVTRIKGVMENLPFKEVGWNPQLMFPVDAELGSNMATLKKVKK